MMAGYDCAGDIGCSVHVHDLYDTRSLAVAALSYNLTQKDIDTIAAAAGIATILLGGDGVSEHTGSYSDRRALGLARSIDTTVSRSVRPGETLDKTVAENVVTMAGWIHDNYGPRELEDRSGLYQELSKLSGASEVHRGAVMSVVSMTGAESDRCRSIGVGCCVYHDAMMSSGVECFDIYRRIIHPFYPGGITYGRSVWALAPFSDMGSTEVAEFLTELREVGTWVSELVSAKEQCASPAEAFEAAGGFDKWGGGRSVRAVSYQNVNYIGAVILAVEV